MAPEENYKVGIGEKFKGRRKKLHQKNGLTT